MKTKRSLCLIAFLFATIASLAGPWKEVEFESDFPQTKWDAKRQAANLIGHVPVLFLDEHFVLSREGVERTLHALEKRKDPILPYGTEKHYKWLRIVSIVPDAEERGTYLVLCRSKYKEKYLFTAFRTRDGINLDPIWLNQVPSQEIWDDLPPGEIPRRNNVFLFDSQHGREFGNYYTEFFRTAEDPAYPYGAVVINKSPRPRMISILRSKNAFEWELLPNQERKVVEYESNNPTYDAFRDCYLSYMRLWDPKYSAITTWRKVIMSEAVRVGNYEEKITKWTDEELVFQANERDGPATDVYNLAVAGYAGKYVGVAPMYHRAASFNDDLRGRFSNELAFSHDGREWERVCQGTPFLKFGPEGAWDSGMIGLTHSIPAIINDRLWYYFFATKNTHDAPSHDPNIHAGAASLRIDGFVSLDAGPEGGVVLTVPFWPQGKHLYINADARGGEIRVEVLQNYTYVEQKKFETAEPVLGLFRVENCLPFSGEAIAHRIEWKNGENFVDDFPDGWNRPAPISSKREFSERAIALKFHLRNASLYSFWFADQKEPLEKGRLVP